jgi:hypothetical protein
MLCTGRTAHKGSRGIVLLFLDHGTRRGEGSASRPGRSLSPGKTRYPLYRSLGGPQGRSGQVRKISPVPRFDPRIVQPVANRFTDYTTRSTVYVKCAIKSLLNTTGFWTFLQCYISYSYLLCTTQTNFIHFLLHVLCNLSGLLKLSLIFYHASYMHGMRSPTALH